MTFVRSFYNELVNVDKIESYFEGNNVLKNNPELYTVYGVSGKEYLVHPDELRNAGVI